MGNGWLKTLKGALSVALLAGGTGLIGALGVGLTSTGTAAAASTGGRYTCATPIGKEHVQVTITTLHTTTPKTVPKTTNYSAKPQAKATIPSSLIATAHTATPSLTSLSLTKATLSVNKVNFSGTGLFHANNVPHTVPITTTTEAHGAIITITYTAKTFTGTATSGKATLTPATLLLHVEVTLTCYPPAETVTYTKKAAPTTTETTFTHYVVAGSDTLGVITTVNATAAAAVPTITKVTPGVGPTGGGTTVTLTGSNFVSGATTVTFGGTVIPAGSVTFVTTSQIKVSSPSHAAGTVTVKATTTGGTSASGEHFTYEAAPTITKVTPGDGPTGGGTTVTLTGSNFVSGATTVTFGGTVIPAGSVTFVTTSQIKVSSPSHAAATVTVKATTAGGTSGSGEHFTYVVGPTISKVTPAVGPTAGGTTVTLTGTGFISGATTVTFGGTTIPAGSVTFVTTSQIKVSSPSHAAATVTVKATTAGGTSGSGEHFTYEAAPTITKVTPAVGPIAGGTTVTLTGSGFVSGATTVTFGGTVIPTGSVTFVTTSQIKVSSPAHAAATVTVKATTAGGTSASGEHFTYEAAPTITKVTPGAGPTTGATTVTLTGTGFVSGATTVTFGGTVIPAGSVTFVSSTQIKVSSPSHAAGTVTVKATTTGGTSASGEHFIYEAAPTITKVTPSVGPTGGGTTVTITGSNFVSGATTVTFGGTVIPAGSVTFVSTSRIKVSAPSHAAATVTVKATTAGGTSGSGEHFTYEAAPTITKVTPAVGPIAGGTTVTLTGSGFVSGATTVTFGGTVISTGSVTFVTTSQIKVSSPAHAAATVTVKATTAGGTSASGEHFTYEAAPTITKVTPGVGPIGGGTTVTLTGSGFVSGATTVTFGGTLISAGSVTFVSTSQIKVSSPAHAAATVTVKATTAGGTSGSGEHFVYGPPSITKVTPNAGPTGGGTTVTLTGSGFVSGATTVTFGGTVIPAGSVTFVSSTQIKVSSPSHASGSVTVKATTAGGTSGSGEHFLYGGPAITSFTPPAGPTSGGTTVTITGTGFTGATAVHFGTKTAASFHVTSATTIKAVTKSNRAGLVTVTVTTPGGTAVAGSDYRYEPVPFITNFTPTVGTTAGGTMVTITGSGFVAGSTTVKFGTTTAASVVVTATNNDILYAVTKPHAAGPVTISITTAGGMGTSSTTFTFLPVPTLTSITPTAGKLVGGTVVTLRGTNFVTGVTSVKFGATTARSWTVTSPTKIVAVTEAHSTATVTVTVDVAGGISNGKPYTYDPIPTISTVTPSGGKLIGGTVITLTGSGYRTGATAVTFGAGNHGTTVHVLGTTSLTVKAPSHAAGTVTVTVTTPGGTSGTKHYSYDPIPTLSTVTPSAGKLAGGTVITLTGTNFRTGATSVTFGAGNHGTTVNVIGTTTLTVKAPSDSAGTVTVTVTTPGGTSGTEPYTYDPVPTLSTVTPSAGKLAGGTVITLTGIGLPHRGHLVTFGAGNPGATVDVIGTTTLTVKAPSDSAGTVTVTVTTPGGTSGTEPYTYDPIPTLSTVTPSAGKLVGGTVITLTGSGFRTGATSVTFGAGNHGTTVNVTGTTTLTVKAPSHSAGTVTVTVTTPGGTSGTEPYTYDPIPTLSTVTPSAGKLVGGTVITLTGSGFRTGATSVTFGAGNHGTTVHVTRHNHPHRQGAQRLGRHGDSDRDHPRWDLGHRALHLRPDPDSFDGHTDRRQAGGRDSDHPDRIRLPHRGHLGHIRRRQPRHHSPRLGHNVAHRQGAQPLGRHRDSDRDHPRWDLGHRAVHL